MVGNARSESCDTSWDTNELVSILSPILSLAALGALVGKDSEGGGQEGGHRACHRHPVGSPQLAGTKDEGICLWTTQFSHPP